MPGTEFMQAIFDMSPGDVGVEMNQPRTIAIVIRLVDFIPSSEQELQKAFEEDDPFSHEVAVLSLKERAQIQQALEDQAQTDKAWKEEMMKTAGFHWEIKPTERLVEPED